MSNPTSGKPASCELLSSDPLFTLIRTFVTAHEGAGLPRDIAHNVMPQRGSGVGQDSPTGLGGIGTGRAFVWNASGLASSPCLQFKYGSSALHYVGSGYGTGGPAKRTIFCVLRCDNYCTPAGGHNILPISAGARSGDFGLCLQALNQTTYKLGVVRSSQAIFPTSTITLAQGIWYALAISTNSANKDVLFQGYDYTNQVVLTNSGQVLVDSVTIANSNTPEFVLNGGVSAATSPGVPFVGQIYCAGLHDDYWDTSSNNLFPGFYTDPVSLGRGTYTPSGGLVAGSSALTETTTTQIFLSAGRAAGTGTGGSGNPTYQWYRDPTSNATPGVGNILSGQTALNLTDTPPSASTPYFYTLVASDGSSTAQYTQVPAVCMPQAELKLGLIGDSITLLSSGDQALYNHFRRAALGEGRPCTLVNQGCFGSLAFSGSTGLSWDPTSGLLLPAAKSAFAAEGGITWVICMLGSNDAAGNLTAAQFETNLAAVVSNLITAGYKVMLVPPPYSASKTAAQCELLRQYGTTSLPAIAAANPGNCVVLPADAWNWSLLYPRDWDDGLHPNGDTAATIGHNRWRSVKEVLFPSPKVIAG